MYDVHQAAEKLKINETLLKSNVPCTDYTFREENGKKEITGYFWSQELIDRLVLIQTAPYSSEDLLYIADTCCNGDHRWAKDMVHILTRTNKQQHTRKKPGTRGITRPSVVNKIPGKPATPA